MIIVKEVANNDNEKTMWVACVHSGTTPSSLYKRNFLMSTFFAIGSTAFFT